jgi:NAD(P)-dependent dehydrogenase (short-subunit alcohol dehydrogenase family)
VVAKWGSEAYDVSKAALSHLVRELATALAPKIRVNGVSPATVVIGSTPTTAHAPSCSSPSRRRAAPRGTRCRWMAG